MSKRFEGRVALVTGGASGIGRAVALAFASEGARVVIGDLQAEAGELVAGEIRNTSGAALFVPLDVSDRAQVENLVRATLDAFGQIDCAINNAGIAGAPAPTHEYPDEDWEQILGVNLKGVWYCMKAEIPVMLRQGHGAIVNTSSAAGLRGFPSQCAYSVSKHGVIGLTRTAALEYVRDSIRVNAVCPGWVHTGIVEAALEREPAMEAAIAAREPVGRWGAPEEIAAAILWLCSDDASFITGQAFPVDGGISIA